MSKDLLLEIGLEEMPARLMRSAMEQLREKTQIFLQENRLNFSEIEVFSTPRRLAVRVLGIADKQEDTEEEVKGPAKKAALDDDGNWTKAAQGFARGQKVALEDIIFKELKGVEYVYVKKFILGASALEALTGLKEVILSLTFPVSMRWADYDFNYIRPIHWIVAMLNEEVIPFKVLNIETGNHSQAHRLNSQKEINFAHPKEYLTRLAEVNVLADVDKRKAAIVEQIEILAHQNQWKVQLDPELLEEVTHLVEYPTAFAGKFSDKYLEVPEEVLITSMKEHQRFFEVRELSGNLSPHFISVRNGGAEHLEKVIKGNQKVLTARLEDGEFFWQEDQKFTISDLVEKLKRVTFHEKIGMLSEHMERVKQVAEILADEFRISDDEKRNLLRAAEIYKFDLVTHMVEEFSELQGVMGEKYARLAGESKAVSCAIREHYLPKSSDKELPETLIGSILAVSDRLDSLYSFFAVGLIPSGSNDPYALRRSALGIVRIFLANDWKLSLVKLQDKIIAKINQGSFQYRPDDEVLEFLKARMKQVLTQNNIRHDIVEAVLGSHAMQVIAWLDVATTLQSHSEDSAFKAVMENLARVVNLAKKAEQVSKVDPSLFENEEERSLHALFLEVKDHMLDATAEQRYQELVRLQAPIEAYFENTFVNVEDEQVKNNRYSQLSEIAEVILDFAAVGEIIVK
ncbi:MAG: glycine--tRNA ligase subunit beta [Lactobacillales bacterium]|jgi:glycyl-tRNA synthetase beta chain|nr:glycine--tRNA ligase subunit beta [Lactobacillales bacterium]